MAVLVSSGVPEMRSKLSVCHRQLISVVSDHPVAADSITKLLREVPQWSVAAYNSASYAATLHLPPRQEELVIIDKGAAAGCFPVGIRQIKRARPSIRFVVLDQPLSSDEECLLLYLGVHGFVPYKEVQKQLKSAVRAVLRGRLWFKPERLHNYVEYLSRRSVSVQKSIGAQLTQREQEIATLIRRGLFTAEIGRKLNISSSTVKFHVGHILSKLGLKHRREILAQKLQDAVIPINRESVLNTVSLNERARRQPSPEALLAS